MVKSDAWMSAHYGDIRTTKPLFFAVCKLLLHIASFLMIIRMDIEHVTRIPVCNIAFIFLEKIKLPHQLLVCNASG